MRGQPVNTPAGDLFTPLLGTTSLLPTLSGVLDIPVIKTTTEDYVSRKEIQDIAGAEISQALRDIAGCSCCETRSPLGDGEADSNNSRRLLPTYCNGGRNGGD